MRLVREQDWTAVTSGSHFSAFGFPFSRNGNAYYRAVIGSRFVDLSFGFADTDGICAVITCNNAVPDRLTCSEAPIEIWVRPGLTGQLCQRLVQNMLGTLRETAKRAGMGEIILRAPGNVLLSSALAARLLSMNLRSEPSFQGVIDLTQSDEILFAAMRSGHRQQVRWGERNMTLLHVNKSNPDRAPFEKFRALHAEVAGRITRPSQSWDEMFELVRTGNGNLVLSVHEGKILGGTLVLDADGSAYYSSGAYLRNHFDKPLTHYPLFASAIQARARGNHSFVLGEIGQSNQTVPDKERSIGQFKAGFTSDARASLVWTIPVGA
jgi:hypothetical protein